MKNTLGILMVIVVFTLGIPMASADSDKVTEFVDKLIAEEADENINKEIARLKQQGVTKKNRTQAVLIGGKCGVAGCDERYLVSTTYQTPSVARGITDAVMTIVVVPAMGKPRLKKVLDGMHTYSFSQSNSRVQGCEKQFNACVKQTLNEDPILPPLPYNQHHH